MAGKGGGAWKVAYADFVTAMMAFFMVMWLVGQKQDVKEAIAEHFREPYAPFWASTSNNGQPHHSKRSKDDQHPSESSATGHPDEHDMKRVRGIAIRGSERSGVGAIVFFAEDSVELDAKAKQNLDAILPLIVGKPQKIEVRGHTSRKPLPEHSPYVDMWQLCYVRCEAVRNYLIQHDIPPDRLRLSQSAGYEPFSDGLDAKLQARNQRVEVFLLTEVADDHPSVENSAGRSELHGDAHGSEHNSDHGQSNKHDDHDDAHGDDKSHDEPEPPAKPKPPRKPAPKKPAPAAASGHGAAAGHGPAKPAHGPAKPAHGAAHSPAKSGHGAAKPAAGGHGSAKPAKAKGGH